MRSIETTPVPSYAAYADSLPRPYKDGLFLSGKQALPYWDKIPDHAKDGAENPAKQRLFFVRRVEISPGESHATALVFQEVYLQPDGTLKFGVKHIIPQTTDPNFYGPINGLLDDLISSRTAFSPEEGIERIRFLQTKTDERTAAESMAQSGRN